MQPNPARLPAGATLKEKKLVIGILSAPQNDQRREIIRRILSNSLSSMGLKWSYFFVIGRPGSATNLDNDILYVNCEDAYESLPLKTYNMVKYCADNMSIDYLFKTDDDCFINLRRSASLRHWNRDYFGLRAGEKGHSLDWHFGKTSGDPALDMSAYKGPWASGSGYFLSAAACQWISSNIDENVAQGCVFEDKMIGDAMLKSNLSMNLHSGFNATNLNLFFMYNLDNDGCVVDDSLAIDSTSSYLDNSIVLHLGSLGSGLSPKYRVREETLVKLFDILDRYFSAVNPRQALISQWPAETADRAQRYDTASLRERGLNSTDQPRAGSRRRLRSLGRTEISLLVETANAASRLGMRPYGLPLEPDQYGHDDPLVLAYWPFGRTNNFQGLLYSQGWRHSVAPFPLGQFEEMASVPWPGPMACHFHWLASIEDEAAIRRFETLLARLKDQRRSIVWTVHNVLPHDQADIDKAVRIRRAIVEAADLIHIMNERTPELVEPHFSLAGKRVFYSPHPSYLGDHPNTVSRDAARFDLGLRPEATVFLSFGAIRPYKGVEELIVSAQELARDRPDLDWMLVVAGIADDHGLVRRIRCIEALDRRLLFYPQKIPNEDVQNFFRAADYAVCAHRSSLNSGAAMLAMSFGVPLVAPETAAFSEFLERGAGIGYAPDDRRALAAALAQAIETDPAGMRGRALALAKERSPETASSVFFEGLTAGLRSGSEPLEVA